ncbi:MAG: hypothetical protein ABIN25_13240 [Ginsengibacter sp.]
MSIDNIQLPAFLKNALFKNKLISPRLSPSTPKTNNEENSIEFLGGNLKNIAFVVNVQESKFVTDSQLNFLSGLVNACHVSLDDIAVVNIAGQKFISYLDLAKQLSSRKILSFGVAPAELNLPFTIPFYQVQSFQETDYIFCPELNKLQDDTNAKKLLWASLQKTFKIN